MDVKRRYVLQKVAGEDGEIDFIEDWGTDCRKVPKTGPYANACTQYRKQPEKPLWPHHLAIENLEAFHLLFMAAPAKACKLFASAGYCRHTAITKEAHG